MPTIFGMKHKGRVYEMEVGAPGFELFRDRETKRLAMVISRPTQFPNIWWFRFITLRLKWPWLRNIACFRDVNEPENG